MRGRKKKKRRSALNGTPSLSGITGFETGKILALIGVTAAVGFAGIKAYRKVRENKSQRNSLNEGDPSAYATQLYLAMGNQHWYSSSSSLDILKIIREIPTRQVYSEVQTKYKDSYHENLNAVLQQRLKPEEYDQAIRMISSKPEGEKDNSNLSDLLLLTLGIGGAGTAAYLWLSDE